MFSQPSRPRRSSLESGWGSTSGFLVVMGQIPITRTSSLYIYWFHDSKFLGLQPISILVPKIWFHVPHPSNGQNMSKTTPFRRQKRRFLERFWFQEIWWRRLADLTRPPVRARSARPPARARAQRASARASRRGGRRMRLLMLSRT